MHSDKQSTIDEQVSARTNRAEALGDAIERLIGIVTPAPSDEKPFETSQPERHQKFFDCLNEHGEDAALAEFGDPQYWDQCRHGQWYCRYGGRQHAKSACIHEDAPQHECTTPTVQLGLFGAGL